MAAPFLRPCRAGFVERLARTVTPRGWRAPLRVDLGRSDKRAGCAERRYEAWICVMGGLWTEQKRTLGATVSANDSRQKNTARGVSG